MKSQRRVPRFHGRLSGVIERLEDIAKLTRLLRTYPVVGILGARQVGKTTLARQVAKRLRSRVTYFDLEDHLDLEKLADPGLALRDLRGLVVIDEVQRRPELFPILRVFADRAGRPARFLVLGSAAPRLLRQSSESLAGRIHYHELSGLSLADVGPRELERRWLRGGYPLAYLAKTDADASEWRENLVRTYLERDLPELGISLPSVTMRRMWTMLAHYHGQRWSASEFGRAFGVSDSTVRRHLDSLSATFMVRQLLPWRENIGKRQVKAPKVYIADSGLLHQLLNVRTMEDLESHPKVGASWEGFMIEEVVRHLDIRFDEAHYWATHQGAELDLLVVRGRKRLGFEIKRSEAPKLTPSMRIALEDLKLSSLTVIHAGKDSYPMSEKVRAVAASRIHEDIDPL